MDALLYLDFYAEKPTLFIKKQDSFRTYIGSILSLVTTIVLSIIIVFIIFCFIHDTGLTVLYDKTSKGLSSLDLNLSKNIFFYHLNDKAGNIIDKRIIRAYPYLTISSSGGTEYKLLKEVPCDINKLIKSNNEYEELLNFDVSSYQCVTMQDGEDVVLQRRSSPFKNSYINLFVTKCHNDTKNNISDCKSEEEIDSYIENNSIYVNFFLESAAIDHHNYTNPLTKKYYQNSMSLPKDFIFSYSFFWRKIEYLTRNSLILFSYLFQSTAYMLDASIKDKDFFPKTHTFYEQKTIGRLQFLITVEYAESYVRKYITLIDSLTLLMTGFNVITKLCYFVNYLFTKSYIYCSIFEPIVSNRRPRSFKGTFENNVMNKNYSPSPSCSKLQLVDNKKKMTGLSIVKVNSKTVPLNKTMGNIIEDQRYDEVKSILSDIQNKRINSNVGVIDNFLFLFAKLFNSNNKKQLYLQRLEKILQEELSIDHLFQQFRLMKLSLYKNIKQDDNNQSNYYVSDGTPFKYNSNNNISSVNNL